VAGITATCRDLVQSPLDFSLMRNMSESSHRKKNIFVALQNKENVPNFNNSYELYKCFW
jgi:hypothetical protein